jgi:single-strand DNA-binding protein
MNSCILMAEVIVAPERRYTQGDRVLTEMRVQFPGLRAEDPLMTLKVVGWGNLAEEIYEKYHLGDRIIVEGRLSMNTIDRPEGFKEKRAELVASKIYPIEVSQNPGIPAPPVSSTNNYTPPPVPTPVAASPQVSPVAKPLVEFEEDAVESSPSFTSSPTYSPTEQDLDDIPF